MMTAKLKNTATDIAPLVLTDGAILTNNIDDYPSGIIIPVDKPYRWTSADVIRKIKFAAVRYFGKKPYEQLAGYVHYFDVCMIPFVINGITAATSPVKLFEYMSMEKPVVSTALPECLKYDAVSIAHSPDEFVRLVTEAWDERDNDDVKEKLRQCARGNDWSAKAQELKKCLSQWESDER